MAERGFTGRSFLWRLLFALLLVGATYNPEGYSYYHWALTDFSLFGPEQTVVGVLLLIGWVIYLRATLRSLGLLGLVLVVALCASLVWLLTSWGWIAADSPRAITYVSLVIVALILATGMSWSHVRRRISGQADVDAVDGVS
ncbi:MAG: hypothetical protein FJ147_15815 [Deltaproteobacteria bacterium]|nr:hypothetical protein [Deltaproteobacteria bacterium]